MASKITVGTTFKTDFIRELARLNKEIGEANGIVIGEVYGSIPGDKLGTARALDRLHDCDDSILEEHVKVCHDNGIEVAYANNSLCLGSLKDLDDNYQLFLEHVEELEKMGVDSLILAIPFFIQEVKKHFPKMKTVTSTIAHVDNVKMAQRYAEFGAGTIVLPVDANRDFSLLRGLKENCPDIDFELLMTDACIYECPYRQNHFAMQSHDSLKGATGCKNETVAQYPFDRCWADLTENFPAEFLKSRWIRPEDVSVYEQEGFHEFKISGRTMPEEKILRMVRSYLSRRHEGNLLEAFPIIPGDYTKEGSSPLYLDNRSLDGFLKPFVKLGEKCRYNCGTKCTYCDDYAEKIKNE